MIQGDHDVRMVVIPEGVSPVIRQRIEWGQNLDNLLKERGWTRKRFVLLVFEQYGIEISEASLSSWIKGDVAPRSDAQAAMAGVAGLPHHMLFPPIKLAKRAA